MPAKAVPAKGKPPTKNAKSSSSRKGSGKSAKEDDSAWRSKVESHLKKFELTLDSSRKVMHLLNERFNEGLREGSYLMATVRMLPSYVRALPNGEEVGSFLALDLGGTNFRVLLVKLEGQRRSSMKSKIYHIPHSIMVGTGEELFDHIAHCMATFIVEEVAEPCINLPLGFTFSFGLDQIGLTKAYLVRWTKGFKRSGGLGVIFEKPLLTGKGVEGRDVVRMLQRAVKRRQEVDVDVVGILNDTVGCMMSCAFLEPTCCIGVIVGTGSNACYMEKLENITKLDLPDDDGPREMCINTEWGAFGDDGCLDFLRTEIDVTVDRLSINAGKQLFEKMISGMYMGEVVRMALEELAKAGLLFKGQLPEKLIANGAFPTKFVSEVESDLKATDSTYTTTMGILKDIGVENPTITDCEITTMTCVAVSTRAAHLCAAGVATILNRMARPFVTVSVDGSVYRFHPFFKDRLRDRIALLINAGLEFKLMLSEDGSGRGAALVAAVASRLLEERAARHSCSTEDKSTETVLSPRDSWGGLNIFPEDPFPVRETSKEENPKQILLKLNAVAAENANAPLSGSKSAKCLNEPTTNEMLPSKPPSNQALALDKPDSTAPKSNRDAKNESKEKIASPVIGKADASKEPEGAKSPTLKSSKDKTAKEATKDAKETPRSPTVDAKLKSPSPKEKSNNPPKKGANKTTNKKTAKSEKGKTLKDGKKK